MDKKQKRREFLKKAAYSVPVIATLGSVSTVEACGSCSSPNGNCDSKFGDWKNHKSKYGDWKKKKSKFGNWKDGHSKFGEWKSKHKTKFGNWG